MRVKSENATSATFTTNLATPQIKPLQNNYWLHVFQLETKWDFGAFLFPLTQTGWFFAGRQCQLDLLLWIVIV